MMFRIGPTSAWGARQGDPGAHPGGGSQSGLVGLATTFSARSPQLYLDIDRTKADSLGIPAERRVLHAAGLSGLAFVNLFNKFNQVFQVYMQADSAVPPAARGHQEPLCAQRLGEVVPLGTLLYRDPVLSSELITRYNLYPAAAAFGAAAPASAPARR